MALLPHQYREERPWGSFERFTHNETSTVKILHVAPDQRFSLQKHASRSEFWRVIQGSGLFDDGNAPRAITLGDTIELPVGALHRLTGGPDGISVLEIALGTFTEDDIERIEDDYGRT